MQSLGSSPPLPRALALIASCLMLIGVACLVKNGQLGTLSLHIGLTAIACALLLIGCLLILEYRRAPEQFRGLVSPRRSAARLFDNLVALPLPREGRVVFSVQESFARRVRRRVWLGFGLALTPLILLPFVNTGHRVPHDARQAAMMRRLISLEIGVSTAVLLVAGIVTFFSLRRLLRSRLGIDALGLLYDDGRGELQRHDWSEVRTDRHSLLIGRHWVTLDPNRGSAAQGRFPGDLLRGYVLARLPAASYVSHNRLLWTAAGRSTFATRLWYGGAVALFILTEYLRFNPDFAVPVRRALVDWLIRP